MSSHLNAILNWNSNLIHTGHSNSSSYFVTDLLVIQVHGGCKLQCVSPESVLPHMCFCKSNRLELCQKFLFATLQRRRQIFCALRSKHEHHATNNKATKKFLEIEVLNSQYFYVGFPHIYFFLKARIQISIFGSYFQFKVVVVFSLYSLGIWKLYRLTCLAVTST